MFKFILLVFLIAALCFAHQYFYYLDFLLFILTTDFEKSGKTWQEHSKILAHWKRGT